MYTAAGSLIFAESRVVHTVSYLAGIMGIRSLDFNVATPGIAIVFFGALL